MTTTATTKTALAAVAAAAVLTTHPAPAQDAEPDAAIAFARAS